MTKAKPTPPATPPKTREKVVQVPVSDKLLLTVDETAAVLNIGRDAVYGFINQGLISTVQSKSRRLVVAADLPAFINHLKEQTNDQRTTYQHHLNGQARLRRV